MTNALATNHVYQGMPSLRYQALELAITQQVPGASIEAALASADVILNWFKKGQDDGTSVPHLPNNNGAYTQTQGQNRQAGQQAR